MPNYVTQYRAADRVATEADEQINEWQASAEEAKWTMARVAWEACAQESESRTHSTRDFANAVGKSQPTVTRQIAVWRAHGDAPSHQRLTYTQAYYEVMGEQSNHAGRPNAQVRMVREALQNPDVAAQVMNDRRARTNASSAIERAHDHIETQARARRTPESQQSMDEHPAVLAGLRATSNAEQCVRLLHGVRMTNRLRNELSVIIDGLRARADAIEMASEVHGTVGEEVEAFLASLSEG